MSALRRLWARAPAPPARDHAARLWRAATEWGAAPVPSAK